jgi:hypothetical protein
MAARRIFNSGPVFTFRVCLIQFTEIWFVLHKCIYADIYMYFN